MANVNYAQTKYNWDGAYLSGIQGTATGTIVPWGSVTPPSGFLECNGASVSTSTYAALFAVIGYTYGGSGASFLVPDLQDRTIVAKSNTKALATTGGANTVAPTGNISGATGATTLTSAQIPSHCHPLPNFASNTTDGGMATRGIGTCGGASRTSTGSTGSGGSHDHTLSANFVGTANSVLQPYLTLIYIIKT
jgi:microcystin-dependent protein